MRNINANKTLEEDRDDLELPWTWLRSILISLEGDDSYNVLFRYTVGMYFVLHILLSC